MKEELAMAKVGVMAEATEVEDESECEFVLYEGSGGGGNESLNVQPKGDVICSGQIKGDVKDVQPNGDVMSGRAKDLTVAPGVAPGCGRATVDGVIGDEVAESFFMCDGAAKMTGHGETRTRAYGFMGRTTVDGRVVKIGDGEGPRKAPVPSAVRGAGGSFAALATWDGEDEENGDEVGEELQWTMGKKMRMAKTGETNAAGQWQIVGSAPCASARKVSVREEEAADLMEVAASTPKAQGNPLGAGVIKTKTGGE